MKQMTAKLNERMLDQMEARQRRTRIMIKKRVRVRKSFVQPGMKGFEVGYNPCILQDSPNVKSPSSRMPLNFELIAS
jgi:hypothetical protein